jgi:flagellar biosynthesis protein FliR
MILPAGFAALESQLLLWAFALIRPGAAFIAAPLFGADFVPLQLRVIISLALGLPALQSSGFALPDGGLMSAAGVLLIAGEVVLGLAMGFATQLGYASALVAGEVIGNAMGLGFAAMVDPASGQQSPALAQLLSILATFLFLAADGHLALAAAVVGSYGVMPPGAAWLSAESLEGLGLFGGLVLSCGLAIAMPVAVAVILVQLVMGVLARAAPQLNLFSVGLPAALLAGIVLMALALPAMGDAILTAIMMGLDRAAEIGGV